MKKLNVKGFTLIETILAIAILGILSIALTNMIIVIINVCKESKEQFNATLLAQCYYEKIKASTIIESENIEIESGSFQVKIDISEIEKYKGRLFKITIEVTKGEKSLEKIEGYKLTCLQEIEHEENSE